MGNCISCLVSCCCCGCKCCGGDDSNKLSEWLAQVNEEPLDNRQIVDCHHHLWDPYTQPKGDLNIVKKLTWLKQRTVQKVLIAAFPKTGVQHFGEETPVAERYMHDELLNDIKHNVVKTVYVECGWGDAHSKNPFERVGEIEMAQDIANVTNNRVCTGIIGHVDMNLGAAIEDVIIEYKKCKNFRGIRHAITWHQDKDIHFFGSEAFENMGLTSEFITALKVLAKHNLTYESWHYHTQLYTFAEMARRVPELTFICDHVGNPIGIGKYENNEQMAMEEWQLGINELATCPNVMIKLSGLTMPLSGFDFHKNPTPPTSEELAAKLKPYILHCIKQFGPERCMFASNFPMDKVSCSYTVLYNAFQRIASQFTEEEQNMMFHDNAIRIYKLQ